ncbi:MAG TPA: inositol monophosphatase family protein [Xanthobacteraceae bacterium]|jgi:3'(2'), 5'-bisphosphate nucleotidase
MTTTRRTLERAEATRLLSSIADLASAAGARVVELAAAAPRRKPDDSPVTAADEAAEAILCDGLARLLPGLPIIAEEAVSRRTPALPSGPYLLVDPVDGTRELVAGRNEYTVNVALVEAGAPVLGVVYAPALMSLYAGSGDEAFRAHVPPGADLDRDTIVPIRARPRPKQLIAVVSRSHPDEGSERFLAELPVEKKLPMGSSLKFARLAEGAADVYPRHFTVSEWDIAAGHALLAAAGGTVTAPDGGALVYGNDAGFRVGGFIAWGAPPS